TTILHTTTVRIKIDVKRTLQIVLSSQINKNFNAICFLKNRTKNDSTKLSIHRASAKEEPTIFAKAFGLMTTGNFRSFLIFVAFASFAARSAVRMMRGTTL